MIEPILELNLVRGPDPVGSGSVPSRPQIGRRFAAALYECAKDRIVLHTVTRAVKKAAKLNILFTARRLKARPSARAKSQLTHLAWENVTTDVIRGGPVCSDRHGLYVECGRLCNIYYTDVHATGLGYPLCRRLAAV